MRQCPKPNLAIGECVAKLTVVIRPQVHHAGMVIGRAGTSGRRNGKHVREILPELGEQEHGVSCGVLDGLIDSWRPLVGNIRGDASLL